MNYSSDLKSLIDEPMKPFYLWLTRSQALKTKERMAQVSTGSSQMGFGRGSSQPNLSTSYSEEYGRSDGSPASYHGCK